MPRFVRILTVLSLFGVVYLLPSVAFASHCGAQTHCYAPGIGDFCAADDATCTAVANAEVVTPAGGAAQEPEPEPSQEPTDQGNTDTQPTLETVDTNNNTTNTGQTLMNPLKANNLEELLLAILRGVVQLGTIFLVLALVWTGFLFVYAQGAEERIKNARAALMWTVVGGLLLLGAQGIALVLQATVNAL